MNNLSRIRALMAIYHKNTEMYLPHRLLYKVLLTLVIIGILIPCILVVGFISYLLTQALSEAGNPGGGMLFEMQILSAFSMVFGTWVVFSLLFFSSDREHLATLPISDRDLLMSKFIYSFIAESAMEFFILIAVFGGYFIASYSYTHTIDPVAVISAILGVLLVPLIPMIYAALFSMAVTALLKNVKSSSAFFRLTTVLMLAFIGLFLLSLKDMGSLNIDNYLETLGEGQDVFLRTLNIIFFPVPWLCRAVSEGSLIHLILYILVNAAFMALLWAGCGKLYRQGLYTAGALGTSKKTRIKDSDFATRSPFMACLVKELRVLLRTKAFANNCVFINLLFPAMAFGLFHFMSDKGSLKDFIMLYRSGRDRASLLLTMVVIGLSLLATALNTIASTSFTREGAHLSLIKYIPVSYQQQILAKAGASFVFTYPPLLWTVFIICFYMGTPPRMWIYYALLTLFGHITALSVGMALDCSSPYVTWEDEYSALRGNVNSFFNMGIMMLFGGALVLTGLFIYEVLKAPLMLYHALLFLLMLLSALLTLSLGPGIYVYRKLKDL